ncbi:MAG: hypothetical protein ACWGQW_08555, partial [bacterium]
MAVAKEKLLSEAKSHVGSLFDIMQIRRVVIVDDAFAASPAVPDLVGKCLSLAREGKVDELRAIEEFRDVPFQEDEEVWRAMLERALDGFGEEDRKRVAVALVAGDEADGGDEEESYNILSELFSEYEVFTLSLQAWEDGQPELLKEDVCGETLFLFDRDMQQGGGHANQGIEIIAGLLTRAGAPSLYCGLLTRTVDPESESNAWGEHTDQYGLEGVKDRFVVVSKEHLHKDVRQFAQRLKRVAIAPRCEKLRNRVAEVIEEAGDSAKSELAKLSVYDFEQIVFQSSFLEGVWEPDTLIRVFTLFHRRAALAQAYTDDEINEVATEVRRVVSIPWKSEEDAEPSSREIQRMEIYEDGEYLRRCHMPIELGDVFKKKNGNRHFVLLAQPCDLMVRSNGKRARLKNGVLVEIKKKPPRDKSGGFELCLF